MYEESNKRIFNFNGNWVTLVLKIALLAVFVFILCWFFTRNTASSVISETSSSYVDNISAMKEAAFEYFTTDKLPSDIGETEKLSLQQMVDQQMLIDFTDNGKTCDLKESFVQTTKTADENYALKVSLTCGKKSDFIVTTIAKQECNLAGECEELMDKLNQTITELENSSSNSGSNNSESNDKTTNVTNNNPSSSGSSSNTNSSSNSTSSNVTSTVTTKITIKYSCSTCWQPVVKPDTPTTPEQPDNTKKTYYKLVKYGEWATGNKTGDANYETVCSTQKTYDYCKDSSSTYYTTGYVADFTPKNSSYTYTVKLTNFTANEVNSSTIGIASSYFTSLTDYRNYLNTRGQYLAMVGDTGKDKVAITDVYAFRNSSLKSSNFTYKISKAFQNGNYYYVDITINYKNNSNIPGYYANSLGYNVYFVPVKFNVNYAYKDDCTTDLVNKQDYYSNKGYSISNPQNQRVCQYRSVTYSWVDEDNLQSYLNNGWQKTGTTEER